MRTVALLPIKGNSERVKGKNVKPFAGKPLFQWVLGTLLEVDEIDQVVINTDAPQFLKDHGLVESDRVVLRDRKPEICGDFVSMNLVLADDVANVAADRYVMTHTTNPLMRAATIRRALARYDAALAAGEGDSLFSVNHFQTRFYREDLSPVNHDPSKLLRTQDLEPWFEENSNLYIFSRDSFGATSARIGAKPVMFATPKIESADIDGPEEWEVAEALAYGVRALDAVKAAA